ncbi:MAG: EAL domain-containing protein [Desulfovibrionaceae bacterium]|nr:EAL domain-containing protein [Desulfovibrionaceae bacterium]
MFGHASRHFLGKAPTVVFGPDAKRIHDQIRMGMLSMPALRLEATAYKASGQKMWVSLWVRMLTEHANRNNRMLFTFADITSTKLCDVLQHTALEAIARDLPTLEIFTLVRQEVENVFPDIRVAALKMDEHGTLRGTPPFRETFDPEAFHRAIALQDAPVYDALKRQCTVAVQSIKESSYPQKVKDIYAALRIEAVLVEPIYSSKKEVIGLVAFFHQTATEQSDLHLRAANIVARICSITAERDAIRTALQMYTHYNTVTGLPNLNTLSAAAEEIRAGRHQNTHAVPVAALCINIERFRRINKNWGLKASNDTLKIVAQRLVEAKGPHDLLAHSSEDEFVMLSIGCDATQAWETGKRIQAALAAPLLLNNTEVVLSVNIGVSVRQGEISDDEPSRMIEEARNALFRMKPGERAQINFYDECPEGFSKDDISLEARLIHAIEEGKLHLCYQPQVSLQNGTIYGVEALCRWQEEDLGAVAPGKFISLAEETGLIGRLSDWVLREVCRQLSDWRQRSIPVPVVAVNLSALNFHEVDLPEKILRYLEEYALKPKDLMLELTETTLLDNDPATMNTLYKAKDKGLTLSLDDFGTGYSSLSCLRHLPISEMKLDRSFVQDLHVNDVTRRLSKAIIRVGESLNLCVLAEGVENRRQLDLLKKHHYHVVQGHFLAKPLPPDELEDWLEAWEPSTIFT